MAKMKNMGNRPLKKPHNALPAEKNMGEGEVIICPKCHAVYFDKHWHASEKIHRAYKHHSAVRIELCPEDRAAFGDISLAGWEGEVVLKNVHPDKKMEIMEQARNIGKRAALRDPEDKILKFEEDDASIRILTSKNQLAVSVGKQIAEAHKGGKLEIKWSRDDRPARVIWTAK